MDETPWPNLPDQRTVGANSSLLRHRTIEMLEIGKLSEERKRLNGQINETVGQTAS